MQKKIYRMGYKKKDLIEQSLKAIAKHELIFIEDIIVYLPCDKSTFYRHRCHECDQIKEALQFVKTKTKAKLRKKWKDSDNAALNIALYRLCSTDEEHEKLNPAKKENNNLLEGVTFKITQE